MIGTNLAITTKNYAVAGGVTYDADALAYFTANTAITSAADKNAINTFYLGLKSDGIYTKMKAMYLPIWGSAATSKWNLINPLDTNAAFRLTFATGMTFTTGGMTSNGTSGYANTFLVPSSFYSTNIHLSFYSRTSTVGTSVEIGSSTISGATNYNQLRNAVNVVFGQTTNGLVNYLSLTDARGLYFATKISNSSRRIFRNGVLNNSTTTTDSNPLSSNNIAICAANNFGTIEFYSSKQCAFSSIGDGLTDTEASNFYTRVNTLMTYFGINV